MDFPRICVAITFIIAVQAQTNEASCKTPDKQNGNCISLYSCKFVMDLFEATKNPIQWSKITVDYNCGLQGNEPKVCCPKNKSSEETDVTTRGSTSSPPDVSKHVNLKLLPENCGVLDTDPRITHGNKTGVLEFPWMARLLYATGDGNQFECGATIINERYVLTAAHCIKHNRNELVGVRVGDHNFETVEDCDVDEDGEKFCAPPPQNLQIEEIIPHPKFDHKQASNDIGLLRVSPMDFSKENVRAVCLPLEKTRIFNFTGKFGVVTGWGDTEEKKPSPDLLKVQLPMISLKECQEAYSDYASISFRQLCAGGKSRSDSCFGDSGGPLHVVGRLQGDTRMVQQGIVSFGRYRKCGQKRWPGVYSRVAYYMDWILNNIKP